jgi:hypothetical protein
MRWYTETKDARRIPFPRAYKSRRHPLSPEEPEESEQKEPETLPLFAVGLFAFEALLVASFVLLTFRGSERELGLDPKLNSMEIADAGLLLCLDHLRFATDTADNDGDGMVDEQIEGNIDFLEPAVVRQVEGQLGRLGTIAWSPENDTNKNGIPDFGEAGVTPIAFSGGELIAYTVFSQRDGMDNDLDGEIDEEDEAGGVTAVGQGRFGGIVSRVRYTGRFTDLFVPPRAQKWAPRAALVSGGNLSVSGPVKFRGTHAHLHANHFLNLEGEVDVGGNATSSGGLSVSGAVQVKGLASGQAPLYRIPLIDPQGLQNGADYFLNSDGKVLARDLRELHDTTAFGSWNGWMMDPEGWVFCGEDRDPSSARGTYYVFGDAHVIGTGEGATVGKEGGGGIQVFTMTLLATGSIVVTGKTHLQHHHPDGLLLLAGKDIRITGNPHLRVQFFDGIIAAHEQIEISGMLEIAGALLAQDAGQACPLVTKNSLRGPLTLTYHGEWKTKIPQHDPNRPWYRLNPWCLNFQER